MNSRSWARVVAALGLAVAVGLGPVGTAGAAQPGAGDRGAADRTDRSDAAPEGPDPRATHPGLVKNDSGSTTPCPVADPDPPTGPEPFPDPKVTNPGPPTQRPCPETGNPAPRPHGDAAPGDSGDAAPPADQAGPHSAAPTATLRTLADALSVTTTGVTTRVTAPAGLDVGPVEISVLFGVKRLTAAYDKVAGTGFEYHFPHLDGSIRRENVSISLLERGPGAARTYGMVSVAEVVPLFDITVSYLGGSIIGACDLFGAADPTYLWVDPDGAQHRYDDTIGDPQFPQPGVYVFDFARTWTAAGLNHGLTRPTIEWYDRDPVGSIGENSLPRGPQLLPRPESPQGLLDTVVPIVEEHAEGDGDDCKATFRYTVTYQPVVV